MSCNNYWLSYPRQFFIKLVANQRLKVYGNKRPDLKFIETVIFEINNSVKKEKKTAIKPHAGNFFLVQW